MTKSRGKSIFNLNDIKLISSEYQNERKSNNFIVEHRKDLLLFVLIDSVVLRLCISPTHYIDCLISSMQTSITLTVSETIISFDLKSLQVNDSLRPESVRALIWTPSDNDESECLDSVIQPQSVSFRESECVLLEPSPANSSSLFRMSIHLFIDIDSPLFKGFGTAVSLQFSRLGLDIDNQALLRICPFLSDLTSSSYIIPESPHNEFNGNSLTVTSNPTSMLKLGDSIQSDSPVGDELADASHSKVKSTMSETVYKGFNEASIASTVLRNCK